MAHHNLYVRYLLACLLASLLALAAPHATSAQLSDTLTVNSTLDRVDIDPGDGVCDADAGSVTTCTLRAAIMEANALGGTQTIRVLPGEYRLTIGGIDDDESLRGDLDISSNLTIGGGSSTNRPVINGNNLDRVFHVLGAVNRVRFQNLVIRGGATSDKTSDSDAGGGIFTDVTGHVSIRNTLITNNKGNLGGGIATNRGRLTITGSTIQNNQGFGGGGGIAITGVGATNIVTILDSSIANNTASTGGGIRVDDRGFLSLDQSTVANNTATGGSSNFGGGGLLVFATGEASLTNTTISGNSASRGGGISVIGRANTNRDLQLKNATLTRNSGGGLAGDAASEIGVASSIIASNSGNDCRLTGITLIGAHNLIGDNTCALSGINNRANTNPLLGSLALNGGPTRTHLPLGGSLAIDRANDVGCPSVDQRGVPRPQGARCDIGAVETTSNATLGTPTLSVPPTALAVEQTHTLTMSWTVPPTMTWTDLRTVDVQLATNDVQPLVVRFTQGVTATDETSDGDELVLNQATPPTDTLTLFDAGGEVGTGTIGSDTVLASDVAALDLARSRLLADGPQGQTVTVTVALRLKQPLAGKVYRASLVATNDAGAIQEPVAAGTLAVGPFGVFVPFATR